MSDRRNRWAMIALAAGATLLTGCSSAHEPEIERVARTFEDPSGDALIPLLGAVFGTRPVRDWLDALDRASVPCSPIRNMAEVFESPEGAALVDEVADPARGGVLRLVANPLRFDGMRLEMRLAPPVLGADTQAVLEP